MKFNVSEDLCKDVIKFYGTDQTTVVAMEECSEVIQELSKFVRGSGNKRHLSEEIADVLITLKEVCMMYDLKDEDIQNAIIYKQFRQARRMQGVD
jgi:NTP pyrophosphatase (non-canonical NTP hydrolase)